MNFKRLFIYLSITLLGCQEAEFSDENGLPNQESQLNLKSSELPVYRDSVPPNVPSGDKAPKNNGGARISGASYGVATNGNDPVNIAPTAVVRASSTFCRFVGEEIDCYNVHKIIDGDQSTGLGPAYSWTNNYVRNYITLPQTVNLEFAAVQNIIRIDIYTSQGWEIQDYTIRSKDIRNNWTTLVTVVGNTSTYIKHDVGFVIGVAEIEIICQRGPSQQVQFARLNEVEIYRPTFDVDLPGPVVPPIFNPH